MRCFDAAFVHVTFNSVARHATSVPVAPAWIQMDVRQQDGPDIGLPDAHAFSEPLFGGSKSTMTALDR